MNYTQKLAEISFLKDKAPFRPILKWIVDVQVKLRENTRINLLRVSHYRYKEKQVFRIQVLEVIIGSTALIMIGCYI